MKWKFLVAFCMLYSALHAEIAMIKREAPRSLKTSVIVPCVPLHMEPLKELLLSYANQTVLPDEIIVSLSEASYVSAEMWRWFDQVSLPFSLKIIKSTSRQSPGKNRNIGAAHASYELILCNDADDIPHPQRIEIVKHLFEHYELEHLLHGWYATSEEPKPYSLSDLTAAYQINPEEFEIRYHNANVCLLKEVWEKIKWKETFNIDLDKTFNQTVYKQHLARHRGVFLGDLIQWRTGLSTYNRGTTH